MDITQALTDCINQLRGTAKAARTNAATARKAGDPLGIYLLWRAEGIEHAADAITEVLAELAGLAQRGGVGQADQDAEEDGGTGPAALPDTDPADWPGWREPYEHHQALKRAWNDYLDDRARDGAVNRLTDTGEVAAW